MNKKPLISVIIPSYNHAAFLPKAVESVRQQTWQHWELIIIDDASSDDSQAWLQSLSDTRIRCLFHDENQGAAQTLNEALSLANGDYLTILNSDDRYHPERLAGLLALSAQYDFIATDVNLINDETEVLATSEDEYTQHWLQWFARLKQDYQTTQDLFLSLLKGNFLITTSNFFFKRCVWQTMQGFSTLRYVHDYEFVLRLLTHGFSAHFSTQKWLDYRLHDSNTIREAPLKAIQENIRLLVDFLPKRDWSIHHRQALHWQLTHLHQYLDQEWQTALHYQLVAKENTLFALIDDRDHWIKERDNWIAERDGTIQQQQYQLQEASQQLIDRDQWIQERDQQIKHQTLWIQERDGWIKEREQWLYERDLLIEQQQQWLLDREAWMVERDEHIQQLQQQLQSIQSSKAYRLLHHCQISWIGLKKQCKHYLGKLPRLSDAK